MPAILTARGPAVCAIGTFAALCLSVLAGCGIPLAGQSPQACLTSAVGVVRAADVIGAISGPSIAVVDTLPELKQKSAVILTGTVQRTCATQVASGSIYTDATLRVDRLVYDPAHRVTGTAVVVRVPGGQIGRVGEQFEDQPIFRPGERYVLFFMLDSGGQGRYVPVDGIQGALPIQNGAVAMVSKAPVPESDFITQIEQA